MKIIDIRPRIAKISAPTKKRRSKKLWLGLLLAVSFFGVGGTLSYFTDVEVFINNVLAAALLDFDLTANAFLPAGDVDDMDPGDTVSRDVVVVDLDSTPFKYRVRAEKTGGNNAFCDALGLTANLEEATVFSGNLLDLNYSPVDFGALGDEWTFHVSLPLSSEHFGNVSCSFDFVYEAWQANLFFIPAGFSDVERVSNEVASKKEHGDCGDDDDDDDDDEDDEDDNDEDDDDDDEEEDDDENEDDEDENDNDDEDEDDDDDNNHHHGRGHVRANIDGVNVSGNGGNGGVIITGDACASARVINVVNTNVTEISGGGGNITVEINNSAIVGNNVEVSANTGGNSADGGSGEPADSEGELQASDNSAGDGTSEGEVLGAETSEPPMEPPPAQTEPELPPESAPAPEPDQNPPDSEASEEPPVENSDTPPALPQPEPSPEAI